MAPLQPSSSRSVSTSRLEVPTMTEPASSELSPLYTLPAASSSTSNLDLDPISPISPISPRTLYAQSFDRPESSHSHPSTRRFRKNVKEMTGFGTTEEEFEALPIAVRRKVRGQKPPLFVFVSFLSARYQPSANVLTLDGTMTASPVAALQELCRSLALYSSINV